jgi:hypothetical protein
VALSALRGAFLRRIQTLNVFKRDFFAGKKRDREERAREREREREE